MKVKKAKITNTNTNISNTKYKNILKKTFPKFKKV